MIKVNSTPIKWSLAIVIYLVLLHASFQLRKRGNGIFLDNLKSKEDAKRGGVAERVVVLVVGGLRPDVFRDNWKEEELKGLFWKCYASSGENVKLRLKEMLTGLPKISSADSAESLSSFEDFTFVGPPSFAEVLDSQAKVETYQPLWEDTKAFPYYKVLDDWVLSRVEEWIKESKGVVFAFLPGVKVASEIYGPFSSFVSNEVGVVLKRIARIQKELKSDGKNSLILTSDRALPVPGDEPEQVPFLTWGAGLNLSAVPPDARPFRTYDLAPMVSSLLNLSIPSNSIGVPPIQCFLGDKLKAFASAAAADQTRHLFQEVKRRFGFPLASYFSPVEEEAIDEKIDEAKKEMESRNYRSSILLTQQSLLKSQIAMNHYVSFSSRTIYLCVALSLFFWSLVTLSWVLSKVKLTPIVIPELPSTSSEEVEGPKPSIFMWMVKSGLLFDFFGLLVLISVLALMYFYSFPLSIVPSVLFLVGSSWLLARSIFKWIEICRNFRSVPTRDSRGKIAIHAAFFLFFTAIFRYSVVASVCFLLAIFFSCMTDLRHKARPYQTYWTLSSISFLMFLNFRSTVCDYTSILLGTFVICFVVTLLSVGLKLGFIDWGYSVASYFAMSLICFYLVKVPPQTYTGIAFSASPFLILICLVSIANPTLPIRLIQILLALAILVLVLSRNVEPTAYVLLWNHLFSWLLIEGFQFFEEFLSSSVSKSNKAGAVSWSDFRVVFYSISYSLLAFTLAGNSPKLEEWTDDNVAYFNIKVDPILYVFLKSFPMILVVSLIEMIIGKNKYFFYLELKLALTAWSTFVHFFIIPEGSSNIVLQMVYLTSLTTAPFACILLGPSVLSAIKRTDKGVPPVAPERSETAL